MRWPIKSVKAEVLMNSRSWVRLGCVFSVAASMLIGTMGVTKAQGVEIGKFEYLNSCASCHGTTGKGEVRREILIKPPTDLTRLWRPTAVYFRSHASTT